MLKIIIRDVATNILDPIVEYFGNITPTYGFCSPELRRKIHGRIKPEVDQHAAHEFKADGELICSRKGAAVDFLVPNKDMHSVAEWIIEKHPFDRLYYYGTGLPLHVSYGPENMKKAWAMLPSKSGSRTPRKFSKAR